jgi:hypothetical protein
MNNKEKVKKLEEHFDYFEIADLLDISYNEVRRHSEDDSDE